MGILGLWTVAIAMLLSAVIFGLITIKSSPMAANLGRRNRQQWHQENLVRIACADLDDEYRKLLKH